MKKNKSKEVKTKFKNEESKSQNNSAEHSKTCGCDKCCCNKNSKAYSSHS